MFSETVDLVLDRMGRGQADLVPAAVQYVNLTVNELSLTNYHDPDMVEDEFPITVAPYVWQIPTRFRKVRHVVYKPFWEDAKLVPPGASNDARRRKPYFYRANDKIVFANTGNNTSIGIAYYRFPKPLVYFSEGKRPAVYDFINERWMYYQSDNNYVISGISEADKAAKIGQVTNWLLNDWQNTVAEGTLAKLLKSRDDSRAPSTFAVYSQLRQYFTTTVNNASMELL